MPYAIRKKDCKQADGTSGEYIVTKKDDEKALSCHKTREDAEKAIAAREANERKEMEEKHLALDKIEALIQRKWKPTIKVPPQDW